jgi:hypothetical protein
MKLNSVFSTILVAILLMAIQGSFGELNLSLKANPGLISNSTEGRSVHFKCATRSTPASGSQGSSSTIIAALASGIKNQKSP